MRVALAEHLRQEITQQTQYHPENIRLFRSVRVAFALAKRLRQHSSTQPTRKNLSVLA